MVGTLNYILKYFSFIGLKLKSCKREHSSVKNEIKFNFWHGMLIYDNFNVDDWFLRETITGAAPKWTSPAV